MDNRHIFHLVSGPIRGGVLTWVERLHKTRPHWAVEQLVSLPTSGVEEVASGKDLSMPLVSGGNWREVAGRLCSRLMAAEQPIVVAHTERDLGLAVLARLRSGPNTRVIAVVHSSRLGSRRALRPVVLLFAALSRPMVSRTVAVSACAAASPYARALGAKTVVAQPVVADEMPQPQAAPGAWQFLSVGRLVKGKGQDRLLDAVRECGPLLRSAGSKLTVVGDGPEKGRLQAKIADFEIDDLVDLVGAQWPAWPQFSSSHMYLQPSHHEGAGLALMEALCMGLAVASGPVGVASDLLTDDSESHVFSSVPSAADWSWLIRRTLAKAPPSLMYRKHRAQIWREYLSHRDRPEDFYSIAVL